MVDSDDWRRQGQERYLKGVELSLQKYRQYREGWDHDHCEFCNTKFTIDGAHDTLVKGYTTPDNYRWICPKCFDDFKEEFVWKEAKGDV